MNRIFAFCVLAALGVAGSALAVDDPEIAADGGIITKPYKGKYVYVVNGQKRVAAKDLLVKEGGIEGLFNFPVRLVDSGVKMENAGVIVQVNDSPTAPSLLVAPEAAWAAVNVAALATDKPKPEVLKSRIQKEVYRAFLFACGVANSEVQPCLMRTIKHAKDLDRSPVMQPGPSAVMPVMASANQLGIFERVQMTYRDACQEGWAPQPTNDVQKTIWKEVHNPPEKPLKITYDKDKQKPVVK